MPEAATAGLKEGIDEEATDLYILLTQDAPARTVRDALQVKIRPDGLEAKVGLVDKQAKKKGFLGYIFEFGADAHQIIASAFGKSGSSRKRRKGAEILRTFEGDFLGRSVNHPGMTAKPFFKRIIEANKFIIIARIQNAVEKTFNDFINRP